jgi:hypothetical protein
MKIEFSPLMRGDLQFEIIGETDFEYYMLDLLWRAQMEHFSCFKRGNGKTVTPDNMGTGFYICFGSVEINEKWSGK